MDDNKSNTTSQKNVGRPENARRLFVIVAILAVFGIIGGIYSLRTSIQQPLSFTNNSPIANRLADADASEFIEEAELIALQEKDTDKDTLTDFDELYQYGTSPYLADSDSDGIDDNDEINNGEDPNCPKGQECSPLAIFTPGLSGTVDTESVLNTSQASLQTVSADELRTALRNAGAPQSELDSLTDEELLKAYSEVVAEEETTTTTNTSTTTNTTETQEFSDASVAELRDLTVPEIRELLKLGGADEETLSQIDDDTLKAIYLESLQNLLTQ